MRSLLSWLTGLLAFICAVLLVVTLFASLWLVNSEMLLFNAGTYKVALKSQELYSRMPKLLAELISANLAAKPCKDNPLMCLPAQASPLRACLEENLAPAAFSALTNGERAPSPAETSVIQNCTAKFGPIPIPEQTGMPVYLQYLTAQNWETLIAALIPPDEIQTISEQTLDSVFGFLNGKNENPVISIVPVKQTLLANSSEAIKRLLATLPACSSEQLTGLVTALMAGQSITEKMLCNPPEEILALALPTIQTIFNSEIATIPDTFPLFGQGRLETRAKINTARMLMSSSPMLPLALLILMTLLAVRTLASWLKWWGIPIIVSGAVALLTALETAPIVSFAVKYAAAQYTSIRVFQLATASVMDVAQAVVSQISTPVATQSLIILAAGIAMLGSAWLLEKQKKEKSRDNSQAAYSC